MKDANTEEQSFYDEHVTPEHSCVGINKTRNLLERKF